jgi:MFS family permease
VNRGQSGLRITLMHATPSPVSNSMAPLSPSGADSLMTSLEKRSSFSLASIYALRMLGLFLVLPVFAIEAAKYPGGTDAGLVGLAMGIYGLTQGALQLVFGSASDKLGRKKVIIFGLLIYAAGSFVAAAADSLSGLIVGRSLQGAGAVSAVVTALLADQTREAVRTKAMALVGASIGLMFALSLILAPALNSVAGLSGLFILTGVLALGGVAVVMWWVPTEPVQQIAAPKGSLKEVLTHIPSLRNNLGVFVLHAVMLAMWVAVPQMLVDAGLSKEHHWWVYLPAVSLGFLVMGKTLFPMERKGYLRAVFLGSTTVIALVMFSLALVASGKPDLWCLAAILFVFFCGSNILEACQPSIASRAAPPHARGTAMGFYNTLQSLGFFVGGAAGGALMKAGGAQVLFVVCGLATLVWLLLAWFMDPIEAPAR